jgi:hypothetical protein
MFIFDGAWRLAWSESELVEYCELFELKFGKIYQGLHCWECMLSKPAKLRYHTDFALGITNLFSN